MTHGHSLSARRVKLPDPHRISKTVPRWPRADSTNRGQKGGLRRYARIQEGKRLQRFTTEGLVEVANDCAEERAEKLSVFGRIWPSADRRQALSGELLGLLGDVSGGQRGAFSEEKIFHVLRHQLLRFLLPGHEAVLV